MVVAGGGGGNLVHIRFFEGSLAYNYYSQMEMCSKI